jgi:hypothetical protein
MITGALPHLAGLIPNHEVCLLDENVERGYDAVAMRIIRDY